MSPFKSVTLPENYWNRFVLAPFLFFLVLIMLVFSVPVCGLLTLSIQQNTLMEGNTYSLKPSSQTPSIANLEVLVTKAWPMDQIEGKLILHLPLKSTLVSKRLIPQNPCGFEVWFRSGFQTRKYTEFGCLNIEGFGVPVKKLTTLEVVMP